MAATFSYEDAMGAAPAPAPAASPSAPIRFSYEEAMGPPAPSVLKDVAKQAGSALVEGPVMATLGAPGDIQDASKTGGVFDKAYLGLEHKLWDWTGYGPQAGTPERKKFDDEFLGARGATNVLEAIPKTPTTPQILGAAGVQLPEPETAAGRYTRMAGDFAAGGMVGDAPAALAKGLEAGVAPAAKSVAQAGARGVLPGVGAQAATDLAEATGNPDLAPIGQFLGPAAAHATGRGVAAVGNRMAQSPMVAKAVASTPLLGGVGKGMQENIAARHLAGAMSDPQAAVDKLKIDQPPTDPVTGTYQVTEGAPPAPSPDQAVPGFQPTTYQLLGDAKLGQLERADRTANAAPYIERATEQKAAQTRAAEALKPAGDPSAVPQQAQDIQAAIHADADAKIDTARAAAQSQSGAIGEGLTPDAVGAALRGNLDAANQAAKAHERSLWKAIDPDGTLANPTDKIGAADKEIYGGLSPTAQAFVTPAEQTFRSLISEMQPVEPFRNVADLKSELAAAMRSERVSNGQSPAYARMSRLMGAVQDTINSAVDQRHAEETQAMQAGRVAPEDTLEARLQRWGFDGAGASDAEGTVRRTGTDPGGFPGDQAPPNAGGVGTGNAEAGRRGPAASDQGLSRDAGSPQSEAPRPVTPAHRGPPPQSLITFLQRAGGVRDQGGNLKAAGYDRFPGLITRNGVPLDRAREMAVEAGYLGADRDAAMSNTSVNDLLDAIGGHPHYAAHEQETVAAIGQRAKEVAYQKEFAAARRNIMDGMKRDHEFRDKDFNQSILNQATYIAMEDNLSPLEAYELALRRKAEQDEARSAAIRSALDQDIPFDDIGRPPRADESGARVPQAGDAAPAGREAGGPSADGPRSVSGGAGPAQGGVAYRLPTEADAANLAAANAATRERQQTFHEGPMKPVMAPGQRAGEFRAPDAAVPAQVFRNGPAGYSTVKAYVKATGGTPEAIAALTNAASESLRGKLNHEGMLPTADLNTWKAQQAHAIRAIDEVSPGFSSRFDTAAAASDEVVRAARDKVERTREFQKSALGRMLGASTDEAVIERVGKTIAGQDAVARMRDLVSGTASDPAATAGLRNAVGEWLSRQFTVTTDNTTIDARRFRKLFADRAPALREVMTPEQMEVAGKIAESMDQAQLSITGSKIEGSPGSAQDKTAAEKLLAKGQVHHKTFLTALGGAAALGFEHSGVHGALTAAGTTGGAYLLSAFRAAGIRDIQGIVHDALMNPDRARQLLKRISPNDYRERRFAGAIRQSLAKDDDDGGSPPSGPNVPPPTGPFSRGGGVFPKSGENYADPMQPAADARGRIEPTLAPANAGDAGIKAPQPNVPLTGRQARTLRAAGYEPAEIGAMSPQERAKAVRDAEAAGYSPEGRITPADRSAMRGALQHAVHDGRSGDGRFAGRGDLLAHPDITGRIEPTWHPDADATHQAILAHEKRLDGRQPLAPDASIKDVRKTVDTAAGDVLAMARKSNSDFLSIFRKEMEGMVERGASEPPASAAPAERTFAQQLDDLLKSARETPPAPDAAARHTVYKPGRISFAEEVPAGAHQTSDAYETEINGENYYHTVSFVKDGDTLHAVISNIERENDQGQMVPAGQELNRVQMHKLRKSVEGHLEDHVDEQTGEARWNSLTTAEKNAELDAQERARVDAQIAKNRAIVAAVDKALAAGWKPEPPHSGSLYNWHTAPEIVKQFASPKSIDKVNMVLEQRGFTPKRKAGDVVPMARSLPPAPDGARVVGTGPLGPILHGLKGRWSDAVNWLKGAQTGDARGVLNHPEVGLIDVVWGDKHGGLRHIIERHPEVIADLPERLAEMRVASRSDNRIVLDSPTSRAVMRLRYDDEAKTWLMTAYEKDGRRRIEGRTGRPDAYGADTGSSTPPTDEDIAPRLQAEKAPREPGAAAQPDLSLRNERTGASANAQSVSSFRDAMRASDVSGDPKADNLARASSLAVGHRLTRIIGDMPVFTVGPQEMRTLAQGRVRMEEGHEPAGFFDPKSGHIVVLDDAMRNPQEASRLVLHEGLHGALFNVIENSRAARSVLDHLRDMTMAVHFERGGEMTDHYGLTNVHEFMSEAMSNPEFQRFLGSIKADNRLVRAFGLQSTKRTMWDAFVAAVRKILGVPHGEHSMLDAAMKVGGHLLDMAETQKPGAAAPPAPRSPAVPRDMPMPSIGAMRGGSGTMDRLAMLLGG